MNANLLAGHTLLHIISTYTLTLTKFTLITSSLHTLTLIPYTTYTYSHHYPNYNTLILLLLLLLPLLLLLTLLLMELIIALLQGYVFLLLTINYLSNALILH